MLRGLGVDVEKGVQFLAHGIDRIERFAGYGGVCLPLDAGQLLLKRLDLFGVQRLRLPEFRQLVLDLRGDVRERRRGDGRGPGGEPAVRGGRHSGQRGERDQCAGYGAVPGTGDRWRDGVGMRPPLRSRETVHQNHPARVRRILDKRETGRARR